MSNLPFESVNHVETAACRGANGRQYELQIHPIGAAYYDRPGVYVFCARGADNRWQALYVGETQSFQSRLTDGLAVHHQWPSVCSMGATHIATLHVPGGLTLREGIETDLRHGLNPICNLQ